MRGNWVPSNLLNCAGGSEFNSNFHQLLLLRSNHDPHITGILKRKTQKYTNRSIQDEFLKLISRDHLHQIEENIKDGVVQRLSSTYQANCALFDRSTKIGTHVDFHLTKNFGYGGTLKYPHGGHSNILKMAVLKFHHFSLKWLLSKSLFHNSS